MAFILRMVLRSCNKFAMRTEIGEHVHVYFELKTLHKLHCLVTASALFATYRDQRRRKHACYPVQHSQPCIQQQAHACPQCGLYAWDILALCPSTHSLSAPVMDGHANRVFALVYHPSDPRIILSAGWDDTVQVGV